MLCKDGVPDPRFDLHNSPRQLLQLGVAGRVVVQRTTAGTRAAIAARRAEHLYCASFVCASATARALRGPAAHDATFVISGGLDADEDLACAELISAMITCDAVDPAPYIERAGRSAAAVELHEGSQRGYTGVTAEDVPMCLEVDRFSFAMRAFDAGGYVAVRREARTG